MASYTLEKQCADTPQNAVELSEFGAFNLSKQQNPKDTCVNRVATVNSSRLQEALQKVVADNSEEDELRKKSSKPRKIISQTSTNDATPEQINDRAEEKKEHQGRLAKQSNTFDSSAIWERSFDLSEEIPVEDDQVIDNNRFQPRWKCLVNRLPQSLKTESIKDVRTRTSEDFFIEKRESWIDEYLDESIVCESANIRPPAEYVCRIQRKSDLNKKSKFCLVNSSAIAKNEINLTSSEENDSFIVNDIKNNDTILDTLKEELKQEPPKEQKPAVENSQMMNLSSFITKVEKSTQKINIEGEIKKETEENTTLFREHLLQTLHSLNYIKNLEPISESVIREKRVFMPQFSAPHINKTVIFDLDETLVHCVESLDTSSADVRLIVKFPSGESVEAGINIRPYAVECLRELSKNYEIVVFTASHKCYADVVLDYLDPKNEYICKRLYREHCVQTPEGVYVKDLRVLANRDLAKMVIVDNAVYSFAFNLDNGIPIIPFYESKTDKELQMLTNYLESLINFDDLKEQNRKAFKLYLLAESDLENFIDMYSGNSQGGEIVEEEEEYEEAEEERNNEAEEERQSSSNEDEDSISQESREIVNSMQRRKSSASSDHDKYQYVVDDHGGQFDAHSPKLITKKLTIEEESNKNEEAEKVVSLSLETPQTSQQESFKSGSPLNLGNEEAKNVKKTDNIRNALKMNL